MQSHSIQITRVNENSGTDATIEFSTQTGIPISNLADIISIDNRIAKQNTLHQASLGASNRGYKLYPASYSPTQSVLVYLHTYWNQSRQEYFELPTTAPDELLYYSPEPLPESFNNSLARIGVGLNAINSTPCRALVRLEADAVMPIIFYSFGSILNAQLTFDQSSGSFHIKVINCLEDNDIDDQPVDDAYISELEAANHRTRLDIKSAKEGYHLLD